RLWAGHDRLEVREPHARLAHMGAVSPQLVHMRAVRRRLQWQLRLEDLVLLRDVHGPDPRDILLAPRVVLLELGAQPIALIEARIAPEVDKLVERARLRRPGALELAVLVTPQRATDLVVQLEVLALLARHHRVGPQLVDHGWLLAWRLIGMAQRACRRRSPRCAYVPPSPRRATS